MVRLSGARSLQARMKALKGFSLAELKPQAPSNSEPRTLLSMGQHCERMAREWGIDRADQEALAASSHLKAAAAFNEGFYDDLVSAWNGLARDNNVRPDTSEEKLAALKTVFDKSPGGTLTAGNSTPLTDGAAGVLLASEEWASLRGLPVQAYLTAGRTAAVDFVNDEGLLMAPTVAVAEMLPAGDRELVTGLQVTA